MSFQFRNRGGRSIRHQNFPSQGAIISTSTTTTYDYVHDHETEKRRRRRRRCSGGFEGFALTRLLEGVSLRRLLVLATAFIFSFYHSPLLLSDLLPLSLLFLSPRIRRYHPLTFIFFFPEFSALFNGRTSLIEDART